MKKVFILPALLLIAAFLVSFIPGAVHSANNDLRIIGYVFGGNLDGDPAAISAEKLTHINYAFANIANGRIIEGHPEDTERLAKLNALKSKNEDLKILISVGGWSWSGGFSDAVLTKQSREIFGNSAIAFLKKHRIDGIDLDWEYPGQIGAGNTYRPEDRENFTAALGVIRRKLDSLSKTNNESYLLTIATASTPQYYANVEMDKIHPYLDFINIMTYDFSGEWTPETGHHTNLHPSGHDPKEVRQSADTAVKDHLEAGVPAEKIVVGVAFYGRGWQDVHPERNGLYQPAGDGFSLTYKQIADSVQTGSFQRYWDSTASAPYLWDSSSRTFLTYDDPESLKEKAMYIKENGLGGAMFWHYHADDGTLLDVLYRNLLIN